MFHIVFKLLCLVATIVALYYCVSKHLVGSFLDTAVIWAYKPNTSGDFVSYFIICALGASISLFFHKAKYWPVEVVFYVALFIVACCSDYILANLQYHWPMEYTPKPI